MRRLLLSALVSAGLIVTGSAFAAPPLAAKTPVEFDDYKAALAATGGATAEKAADGFAQKYPDSALRAPLFAKAMAEYQRERDLPKMLAAGERVLALDPDQPVALALTAQLLADGLDEKDPERDQKIKEIRKNAGRVIATRANALHPPADASPARISEMKATLVASAHAALGVLELKIGQPARAERELLAAKKANAAAPDPFIYYHLALAEDALKKYADASQAIDAALKAAGDNADLKTAAETERDRLATLTAAAPEPAAAAKRKATPKPQ